MTENSRESIRPARRGEINGTHKLNRIKPVLLYIDDEVENLDVFRLNFGEEFECICVDSPETGMEHLSARSEVAVIIADMKMPGEDGVQFLLEAMKVQPFARRLILTAYPDTSYILDSVNRASVHRYILKPWNRDELLQLLHEQVHIFNLEAEVRSNVAELEKKNVLLDQSRRRLERENRALLEYSTRLAEGTDGADRVMAELKDRVFLFKSPAMEEVFRLLQKVKDTHATVFLAGESGVGKEVIASYIHELGPRKEHPFVAVNLAGFPASLVENELFGHEKGAFTGADKLYKGKIEQAQGGTLFLDEIGELPLDVQVTLLRFLQEKQFQRLGGHRQIEADVRLVFATNQDMEELVEQKKFRKDLYYRMNVFRVDIPPLRERRSDIPLLAHHFLENHARKVGRNIEGISQEAMDVLKRYEWPGNVRELENMLLRAVLLAEGELIQAADLPELGALEAVAPSTNDRAKNLAFAALGIPEPDGVEDLEALLNKTRSVGFDELVETYEKNLIIAAMKLSEGNKARAAKILGLKSGKLLYKAKQYEL